MNTASKALAYLATLQTGTPNCKRKYEDGLLEGVVQPPAGMKILVGKPGDSLEEMTRQTDAMRTFYLKHVDSVPTGQSLSDYDTLQNLKGTFDRLITTQFTRPEQYNVSSNVYFGTVDLNSPNARIIAVPKSDEYLIVLNRTLWEAHQILSFVVAASLKFEAFPTLSIAPEQLTARLPLFRQLLEGILMGSELPYFFTEASMLKNSFRRYFWNHLHTAMDCYIFGHEYAHFLHGHFDALRRTTATTTTGAAAKDRGSSAEDAWSREYEADRTGIDLTVFHFRELGHQMASDATMSEELGNHVMLSHQIIAILGSMLFLDFVNKLDSIQCRVSSPDSSHPPIVLRIAALMSVVSSQMPDDKTRRFVYEQINCLHHLLSQLFAHVVNDIACPRPPAEVVAERRLQEGVLQQVLSRKLFDILSDVYRLRSFIGDSSEPFIRVLTALLRGAPRNWIDVLESVTGAGDFEARTVSEMLDRCIRILERNADVLGITRPAAN